MPSVFQWQPEQMYRSAALLLHANLPVRSAVNLRNGSLHLSELACTSHRHGEWPTSLRPPTFERLPVTGDATMGQING